MRYIPDREPGDWLKIVWHETPVAVPKQTTDTAAAKRVNKYHLPRDTAAQLRFLKLLGFKVDKAMKKYNNETAQFGIMPVGCRKKRS